VSTVVATILAAVLASVLTGLAGFSTIYWQQRRSDRSAIARAKGEAYAELYAASLSLLFRGRSAREVMERGSGVAAGLNGEVRLGRGGKAESAIRSRRQPEGMDIHDWLAKGFDPLDSAWATIHVYGSEQGIELADTLVDLCANYLSLATTPGTGRNKPLTYLLGMTWTAGESKALDEARDRVLDSRKALRKLARDELAND
jgi:hypothetical protein